MSSPKPPLDPFPYDRDPRSRAIAPGIDDGIYVYVQDLDGTIYVLPDGAHLHPNVLGKANPAMYAGDLRVRDGRIVDVTNLSGTFQFDDPKGLLSVARRLLAGGLEVDERAVRFFPMNGETPCVLIIE